MTAGHPRVACCIEGCRRGTTRIEPLTNRVWLDTGTTDPAWICGTHWPRVPRALKHRRRLLIRGWRRKLRRAGVQAFWELPPGSPARIAIVRSEHLIRDVWRACIRAASGEDPGNGELPVALQEDLRRMGL